MNKQCMAVGKKALLHVTVGLFLLACPLPAREPTATSTKEAIVGLFFLACPPVNLQENKPFTLFLIPLLPLPNHVFRAATSRSPSMQQHGISIGAVGNSSSHGSDTIEGTYMVSDTWRRPTQEDIERILQKGEGRGFPGMLGSLDCMHWKWEGCPVAWKGQYTRGCYGVPTIMLEAVASYDLWIWHAFFGVAGSNNDINVLDQSPLFTEAIQGRAPAVQFTVNGTQYNMGYYLTDGIYPEWAAFVKTVPRPMTDKHSKFAEHQEGARKDVERAFGVLQKRWAIIRHPARLWEREELASIMYACIILHNTIVEDERDVYGIPDRNIYEQGPVQIAGLAHGPLHGFEDVLNTNMAIRDRSTHRRLKEDLIQHIWHKFGGQLQQA